MSDFLLALQSHCTAEMLKQKGTSSGKWPAHPCLFRTHTPHILDVQVKPSCPLPFLARAGPPQVTILQHWVSRRWALTSLQSVQRNSFSTFFYMYLKFKITHHIKALSATYPFTLPCSKIKGNVLQHLQSPSFTLFQNQFLLLKFSNSYYVLSGIPFLGAVNTLPIPRTPN